MDDLKPYNRACFAKRKSLHGGEVDYGQQIGIAAKSMEMYTNDTFIFMVLEQVPDAHMIARKIRCKPLQCIFRKSSSGSKAKPLYETGPKGLLQRTVMTLTLKNDPGLLKEYIKIHRPENIWPEVIDNMDAIGVYEMELYLYENQVFMIMDTAPDFNRETDGDRWAQMPREKEWQRFVSKYQKTDPDTNALEKWKLMVKS